MKYKIFFILHLVSFLLASQSFAETSLDAKAFYQLAIHYDKCLSNRDEGECPKNQIYSGKIVELMEKSAAMGYAEAEYALGWMYVYAHRVNKNDKKAAELMTAAANNNLSKAQHFLSYMVSNGIGMPENKEEALRWLILASENGDKNARTTLNRLSQVK